ncbi:MAG: TerB family tellurite resistance protein [Gammaproteobacteria bacterium]|nr:TerB family tellurite resistance protein [Gammaproteobacteria bacterium]
MLDQIRKIFSSTVKDARKDLDVSDDEEVVPLAAALVLLEVAWADHSLEENELDLIRNSLISLYGINRDKANGVIERAQFERSKTTSMYPFTRQLNDHLDISERKNLLVHLWRLNSFDGSPFHYEEGVIRKTAELLHLRHSEFIQAKLEAKSL